LEQGVSSDSGSGVSDLIKSVTAVHMIGRLVGRELDVIISTADAGLDEPTAELSSIASGSSTDGCCAAA
jgi:hypothetical protein